MGEVMRLGKGLQARLVLVKWAKVDQRDGINRCAGGCQRINPIRPDGPDSDMYLCARCGGLICMECTRPVSDPFTLCGKCRL